MSTQPPISLLLTFFLLFSLLLLSAHLGSEAARPEQERPVAWYFLPGAALFGAGAYLLSFPGKDERREEFGIGYVVGWGVASWLGGEWTAFATGFAFAPCVLFPIQVARGRGVVLYDPTTPSFVLSRSSLYAALRAVGSLLARRIPSFPAAGGRLLPALAGGVETGAMFAWGWSGSYDFSRIRGGEWTGFLIYALVKTVVLVGVPVLEEEASRLPPYFG